MAHPLEQRIGQVRRQARQLLVLYGVGWIIAVALGTVLVLGLFDYWIRYQDRGVRLIATITFLGTLGWACYRFGWLPFRRRWSDVEIARNIEKQFPVLADRLATSIDFLRESDVDPRAGSAMLRRAVISETTGAAEPLNFSETLKRRPSRRAMLAAGCLAALAIALIIVAPENARLALVRLAKPFGDAAWPRYYHVEFSNPPSRLATGQTFEVELLADATQRMPNEVQITYRYENASGAVDEETEPMRLLNGTMVARKENVHRPFSYRAAGGDDRTPWMRLVVLEPPKAETVEITLTPPAYAGLATTKSEKNIVALVGTRVEIQGRASKRLQSATVCQEAGSRWAARVSGDGYSFALSDADESMTVEKSGAYWIELVDHEGLTGGTADRWELRAIADTAPSVTIERPTSNIFVTPRGEVPLAITVKDDLAVQAIELRFSRSDRSDVEEFQVSLHKGPGAAAPREGNSIAAGRAGQQLAVEHRWKLSELGLPERSQVTFWATASDYLPQTGKSTLRRISIISAEELEERLAQRQSVIFGELDRVLKLQQDARSKTRTLDVQFDKVGKLTKQDVDHAQSAELIQRQVSRSIGSQSEGVAAQITDFLEELQNNRIDSPDLERHMAELSQELARLGQENLPATERALTSLIKATQAELAAAASDRSREAKPDKLAQESLDTAGENQDQVIESLEGLLKDLAQWDSFRRFGRDVAQLERDQQELARATQEAAAKTLGRDMKSLDVQQQADLMKLAGGQAEMGRRMEKLQQQMAETARSLAESDPLSSETIADALHQAQQQATSGSMRQSSERIANNQLSQAAKEQSKVAADLAELAAILANRREHELTRLVKQLREAEKEMAKLLDRQMGLRKRIAETAKTADEAERKRQLERLAREEKQLQEDTARMARKLERLQAEKAGKSASGAAGSMAQSSNAGQQGDGEQSESDARKAEKDLEEAQQQLAERRKQAEEDLAREQVAKMEDALRSMQERQQRLEGETKRLDDLQSGGQRLTRAQLSTLNDLARQQQLLEGEIALLVEKVAAAEVMQRRLAGAGRNMQRAAEQLADQKTGATTQKEQRLAANRIGRLLEALAQSQKRPENEEESEEGQGGAGDGAAGGDNQKMLAELKVLRMLQEDLNDRYKELVAERTDPRVERELSEVAEEQGQLAELTLKISEPVAQRPEDDPEKLPDVRRDLPPKSGN